MSTCAPTSNSQVWSSTEAGPTSCSSRTSPERLRSESEQTKDEPYPTDTAGRRRTARRCTQSGSAPRKRLRFKELPLTLAERPKPVRVAVLGDVPPHPDAMLHKSHFHDESAGQIPTRTPSTRTRCHPMPQRLGSDRRPRRSAPERLAEPRRGACIVGLRGGDLRRGLDTRPFGERMLDTRDVLDGRDAESIDLAHRVEERRLVGAPSITRREARVAASSLARGPKSIRSATASAAGVQA